MSLKLVLVLGATLVLGACNTMEGLGRDVSATGGALQESAQETQQAM